MAIKNTRVQTQLTAPGVSANLKIGSTKGTRYYSVVVATINTSAVVRVEYTNTVAGSVTGQSEDTTITTNGTYVLPVFPFDNFVRLNFVSEAGGTAVTLTPTLVEEII